VTNTLFDGVTLTVEIAISADVGTYGVWDSGKWDTATWGPDVLWTDVTKWVRNIRTDRGFSREVQAWQAGTATLVLDNRDARFSPDNLSGPYVTAGVTGIRPRRPIRIRATYSSIIYYVYAGYVMSWDESWVPGAGTGKGDAFVTVSCVDEWGQLGGFTGGTQTPIGAGETSGQRVNRVLDNAGHMGARSVMLGRVTMQATTFAANATTELQLVTDSEGGSIFVDSDGTIVFEDEYALMEQARSNTVQASLSDAGSLKYSVEGIQLAYSGDTIKNFVSYAVAGGTAQTISDGTSIALYGPVIQQETRTDLVAETDAQAFALATFFLYRYKDPDKRIVSFTVKPARAPSTLYPQILGRRVRDLVQVSRTPPGGVTLTRKCHIAGIHHTINKAKHEWATVLDLWDATVYQTFATSRWDVGSWDTAAWFF
jgi:hypothetical protein